MNDIQLRPMRDDEVDAVAELIHESTNAWYVAHGHQPIFTGPPNDLRLFSDVYEALDPGCCVVAEDTSNGRLAGSCFYHPRPTHVSLGIMNVRSAYFGRGVARRLLKHITDLADDQNKPTRLVSSAMNLDSFSLYTRGGFVPRMLFHDMTMAVPESGLNAEPPLARQRVRDATLDDVHAIVELESELVGIIREHDYEYFIENKLGCWHVSVIENENNEGLAGFLVSIGHAASNMLGPGVMRNDDAAAALIHAELDRHRGRQPVWLVPAQRGELVKTMYAWGAVNCELHVAQCRGDWRDPEGVMMPTFMPETG